MNHETVLHRMLYAAPGLIIVAALALAFMVIPAVRMDIYPGAMPEMAIPALWKIALIHLLFAAGLISIMLNLRVMSRVLGNILLVFIGVLMLILSLVMSDGASAYLEHGPDMQPVAIIMFICIGCDFIAAVMAFTAAFLQPKRANKK